MNNISFVVATLNCVEKVPVLKETFSMLNDKGCKLLVSDGGSTDGTLKELHKIVGLEVICSDKDQGIYDAWNKALEFVSEGYVAFIGVDDIPNRKFITRVQGVFSEGKVLPKIIFGDRLLKRGKKIRYLKGPKKPELFFGKLPWFDIPHQGCLHSIDLFKNARFDASFKLAGDLKFYLQYTRELQDTDVCYLPIIQVIADDGGISRLPSAYMKYLNEYKRIEKELKISIKYSEINLRAMSMICKIPGVWLFLKSVSWFFRGVKSFPYDQKPL